MTLESMIQTLQKKGRSLQSFHKGDSIHVSNKMVKNYSYTLQENPGTNFDPEFTPHFTPGQMLRLGVFEGKYLNDCLEEFPQEWFLDAIAMDKLRPDSPDININLFKILSRLPLQEWRESGWVPSIHHSSRYPKLSDKNINPDERGWFQWYCRYWIGRRLPELDTIQIKRWKAFIRHSGAIKNNCKPSDLSCRPRQRQALLQWSWNPYI